MQEFEYKVVPAPHKGTKAKGVKTPEDRFAHSIENLLNQMAAEGWEYERAELLPSEERSGLTGSTTNWRNILIFRRPVPKAAGTTAALGQSAVAASPAQDISPAEPPLTAPESEPVETGSTAEGLTDQNTSGAQHRSDDSAVDDGDTRPFHRPIRVSDPRDDQ